MGLGSILALVVAVVSLSFGLFTIYTADIDNILKFVWFFGTWCAINTVLIIYIIFRLEVKGLKIPSIKIGKSKRKGRSDLVIFLIILLMILIIYFIISTVTLTP